MTYEIYRYIFWGGAILAGIMFAVSVFVFFILKIPTVIGDLTGANARRAIESIRNQNENTGEKAYRSGRFNRERGKLTDKISPSGRIISDPSNSLNGGIGTEKLSSRKLYLNASARETTVLEGDLTDGNEATILMGELTAATETTVLADELTAATETTVLSGTTILAAQTISNEFIVEYEITYIHAGEVIS